MSQEHGKIVQVDTPDRIYETPNSVYVADFIGAVNIIEGTADRKDDTTLVTWAEGQDPLTGSASTDLAKGAACAMAIRPEKIDRVVIVAPPVTAG